MPLSNKKLLLCNTCTVSVKPTGMWKEIKPSALHVEVNIDKKVKHYEYACKKCKAKYWYNPESNALTRVGLS